MKTKRPFAFPNSPITPTTVIHTKINTVQYGNRQISTTVVIWKINKNLRRLNEQKFACWEQKFDPILRYGTVAVFSTYLS